MTITVDYIFVALIYFQLGWTKLPIRRSVGTYFATMPQRPGHHISYLSQLWPELYTSYKYSQNRIYRMYNPIEIPTYNS